MPEARQTPVRSSFRPDIEGLRAVAVAMVLLYHLDTNLISGGFAGVDVFFVISGFLITTQLLGEAERTGRIGLAAFYARRAKRLLPAAAVVLVATALLSWWLLPATRWLELGGDIVAAAFYFINWRLAWRSVDYLAEDSVASPVQHFWSLAVEEQYYLLWPVLLLLGLWLVRGRISARSILGAILLVIGVGSFAWSVYGTHVDPGPAYFATSTRLWELAVGGALVLGMRRWETLPTPVAAAVGWAGLSAIVVAALCITPEVAWPGYAAALPVLGTAAVIAGGSSAGRFGPVAVLGRPVMCWIGGLSYSLYLWHWPLFEIAHSKVGELDASQRWALVLATLVLAWLSRRFVEDPVRRSRTLSTQPGRSLSIGLNLSLVGTVAGLVLVALVPLGAGQPGAGQSGASASGERVALGAAILRSHPRNDPRGAAVDKEDWMTPVPALATKDVPDAYNSRCHLRAGGSEAVACIYGKPDAAVTIAMVGDSKVAQWLPAMQLLVERHDWRVVSYTKSNCAFNSEMRVIKGKPYEACYEWNRAVMKELLGSVKPDYLLTTQQYGRKGGDQEMVSALLDWWRPLQEAGVGIIAMANNKKPTLKGYECIERHPRKITACTFKRGQARSNASLRKAVKQLPGARYIDLTDAICPTKRCAPVIGNVLVYRQGSHITRTYAQTLAPRLEAELVKAGVPAADHAGKKAGSGKGHGSRDQAG